MTGTVLLLLTALVLVGYTTAQTDPSADEIDYEAFKKQWMISGEEVAQQVANADNITEEGGQIPNVSELGSGSPFYYPKRCEDGPIPVIYREPGVWYWPAPIQKKCIARCPRDHECIATKTVTKQVFAICFKQFKCFGIIIWVPIGIRRLTITDEFKCDCKPICKPLFCFPPRKFNPKICHCECPPIYCQQPYELDPSSCQCRCPKDIVCEKPKSLNFTTCECTCPPKKCPPKKRVDPKTCDCIPICDKSCPKGAYLDYDKCQCVGNCSDFNDQYSCSAIDSCKENRNYNCRYFPYCPRNPCQCECCQPRPGYESTDCGKYTPYGRYTCNYIYACKWACE